MAELHPRTCHLCEAMCGVVVSVEGGRPTGVRGDPEDPLSRGHICPKAVALIDLHEDPDRLKQPHKRVDGRFVPISWDQAFDEVANRILEVQKKHGRESLAVYQGNPTVHNHGSILYGQLFIKALRTKQRYSATSLDQLPHMLAALTMYGHQFLLAVPDLERTDFVLMLGANPLVSGGSLMTAPGAARRIKELRARGGSIVVVDPRRTETAEVADQHVFIRPGTDALFLAAVTRKVLATPKLGRLEAFTVGLDELRQALAPFTPELVAQKTGVPAETISAIADRLANSPRAVVYGRVGVCTQVFGGLCAWLINVLNVITGNLDREGGSMFASPPIDVIKLTARAGQKGHFARRYSRVRKLPEFGGEFPAAALAEEIDTEGEGRLRALITAAGNPVLSSPNGRRLEAALPKLDLMISIDPYINATTRFAHYILPPTVGLEKDHLDLVFPLLSVRNTAKYSPALFPRGENARHDWEIFSELTARIDSRTRHSKLRSRLYGKLLRSSPDTVFDFALRTGPYGAGFLGKKGLSLGHLKRNPHGIDLGPLRPALPERLYTKDKKIQLAPALYLADLPRLVKSLEQPNPGLALIGRRELRSNNSWMHNAPRLGGGHHRGALLIHPEDAARRGLKSGDRAELRSRAGAITVEIEVSDSLLSGVVCLPHGYGHKREGVQLRVASALPIESMNDVTDELELDVLSGNAALSGVSVEVSGPLSQA